MQFKGDVAKLSDGIQLLDICKNLDVIVTVTGGFDKLSIVGNDGNYEIKYGDKTEFFRGLSILCDKLKNKESNISETYTKKFDTCGIMIDVSRNACLKVETIKDIIKNIAKMGLNMVMLYTEDTFKMDKYPYFGYMRGAYSKDEIKEIVKFGEKFGVELVPCIQTLAHLSKTLRWSYADKMRDTDDILLIGEEETYHFIEEMLKTARECYHTDKIHIGMDEAHNVGLGNYLQKNGYVNRFELLSNHLKKVIELTEKYNFKPMMWSDMFFRLGSKNAQYYDLNAKMPENIEELIPKNLSMVYWDYYNNDEKTYDAMIKAHQQMGREIVFAGGIWTWNGLSPNYDKTYITTKAALSACCKNGIKNVFATMWGDDGAETSIYTALLGMQLYAEYNYFDNVCDNHLAKMFKACTGYSADAFSVFNIDDFGDMCQGHNATVSKQVFYSDVMTGLFDKNLEKLDLKSHYGKLLKKFDEIESQKGLEYLFEYQKLLIEILYAKCDSGSSVTDAYLKGDREKLKKLANLLQDTAKKAERLRQMAANIWYKNNKAFGFEFLDRKLGGTVSRLNSAAERILGYLDGKYERLEELEEKRLYYNGDKSPFVPKYFASAIQMP